MRNFGKWMGMLAVLLGLAAQGKAAEIFRNDDLSLSLGGRFKTMGQLSLVEEDQIRNQGRIYLFQLENRLFANGIYKDYRFNFEVGFGGEAINSSNNQLNLKEFAADIPIIPDMGYFKVGQFKVPTLLESAVYEGNRRFTTASPVYNMFFNTGYDMGVALFGKLGQFDAAGGVLSGAPNLPQRYLPEIFNFPPLTFVRLGISDGVDQLDPFHQKGDLTGKAETTAFAVHVNGMFIQDSNAGHSTDLALQSGYNTTFSANGDYANVVLTSAWNPYLGLTLPNFGKVTATYALGALDFQVRTPAFGTTLEVVGQAVVSKFTAENFAPVTILGVPTTQGEVNIGGASIQASLGDTDWILSGRFAMVIPDSAFKYKIAANNYSGPLTGSDPIYEVTFPSITWHMNENVKLVADALWHIDTPIVQTNDGPMILSEMPSQVSNATLVNPVYRAELVPAGRLMFQFSF